MPDLQPSDCTPPTAPTLLLYVNRYRETAPDLSYTKKWIRTRLDRASSFERSLRGLRDLLWVADCTLLRVSAIAQTRHDTSDGAGRVAVGVVPTRSSDTGRSARSKDFEL